MTAAQIRHAYNTAHARGDVAAERMWLNRLTALFYIVSGEPVTQPRALFLID